MRFRMLFLPCLAALCLALAACGGSSKSSSAASSNTTTGTASTPSGAAKQGGTIKIATVGPDSFDPPMVQTAQANSALHLVYTPLISCKDGTGQDGSKLVPGLADSIPQPENGGLSYTFHL